MSQEWWGSGDGAKAQRTEDRIKQAEWGSRSQSQGQKEAGGFGPPLGPRIAKWNKATPCLVGD